MDIRICCCGGAGVHWVSQCWALGATFEWESDPFPEFLVDGHEAQIAEVPAAHQGSVDQGTEPKSVETQGQLIITKVTAAHQGGCSSGVDIACMHAPYISLHGTMTTANPF